MKLASNVDVSQTSYDRGLLQVGIVHLGFGAFHRGHQAVYLDDYMELTGDLRWGIAAVNLRACDRTAFKLASDSPAGYLLKTTAPDQTKKLRLVRSHAEFADWSIDREASERLLQRPDVHALSITVTESGYCLRTDWSLNTRLIVS